MESTILSLNPNQKEAVMATNGPVLIIAGAGSGKTKTLTHRVAYLIREKGIKPQNILAVTFTNKAAGEMKERVKKLLIQEGQQDLSYYQMPTMGTFHNISAKILRKEIEVLGYKKAFNIFDDQDQLALMKKIVKALEINPDQFNPFLFLDQISKAKNQLIDAENFALGQGSYFEEVVSKVYTAYQKELKTNNALDFDDLIMLTVKILKEFPEIKEKYQRLFQYIMVDEYQDTNHAQYVWINLLAEKHRNLCVVGDDWQSIYGWRGANIQNILNFEKDYPEAKVINLDQNYRSTQVILDAAYGVISKNVNRKEKNLWTEKKVGELVVSFEAEDERDEAEFVAREILQAARTGRYRYCDFAVFYRTNAQSRMMEEVFLKRSIPYRIIGGIKFYQRKEVKDVVAYLRLVQNFNDLISLERVINEPRRGVGPKTFGIWADFARGKELNFIDAGIVIPEEKLPLIKREAIAKFCDFAKRMHEAKDKLPLSDFLQKVVRESGYEKWIMDGTTEGEVRYENVLELVSVAKKFDKEVNGTGLEMFLEEVALVSDTDNIDQAKEAVHLMTLHSAKGLEFPIVFIIGLEEGILPHSRSMLSHSEMEEERRLMYVGITRAKEKIHLIHANQRTIFGSTQLNPPSRFLDDIPIHLMAETQTPEEPSVMWTKPKHPTAYNTKHGAGNRKKENNEEKNKNTPCPMTQALCLKGGEHVRHPEFGDGLVVGVDGDIATIAFKQKGIRKLSLEFAPLEEI
jgi:DNA helicase-2/ATP-dependent DNA helicase PcrA